MKLTAHSDWSPSFPPAPKLQGKTRHSSGTPKPEPGNVLHFIKLGARAPHAGTRTLLYRAHPWRKDRLEVTSRKSSCLVKEKESEYRRYFIKAQKQNFTEKKIVTLPLITVRTDRMRFVSWALIPGSSPNPPIPWSLPQPTVSHKHSQTR